MGDSLLIRRDKLRQVLDANRNLLDVVTVLIKLADEDSDLRVKLTPAIAKLVKSGADLNDVVVATSHGR